MGYHQACYMLETLYWFLRVGTLVVFFVGKHWPQNLSIVVVIVVHQSMYSFYICSCFFYPKGAAKQFLQNDGRQWEWQWRHGWSPNCGNTSPHWLAEESGGRACGVCQVSKFSNRYSTCFMNISSIILCLMLCYSILYIQTSLGVCCLHFPKAGLEQGIVKPIWFPFSFI